MTEDAANIVGSAQVKVTVDPEGIEGEIAAAVERAIQAFESSGKNEIKLTAGVQAGGGSAASATSGKGKAAAQGVDAEVSSVTGINAAVKKALQSEAKGFALPIDLTQLRKDIEAALAQPFKIKLTVEGLEELQQQISRSNIEVPLGQPVTPASQGPARPQETAAFQRTLQGVSGLTEQIHTTYAAIKEAMNQAGKAWGSFSASSTDDTWGKLTELTEKFGPLTDWLQTQKYQTKAGTERTRVTGGSLVDALEAEGVDRKSVIGSTALANHARNLVGLSASGQGGVTPLAEISRGIAAALQAAPAAAPVVSAPAPAVVQQAARVAEAATPSVVPAAVQAVKQEAPTPGAAFPDSRPTAHSIITQSVDEAVGTLKRRVGDFSVGSSSRAGTGSVAFDIDPNAKKGDPTYLTATQVRERNQGQLPTPIFDGFSFSQLVRAAQTGAFSYRAEALDERGKGKGEYILFDPTQDNEATRNLLAGKVATLDDGTKARGIKPEEFAERMIRAASGTPNRLVPDALLKTPAGGSEADSPAMRVITKILGPAARAFESSLQVVKGGQEVGKRSGQFTGTQTRLDEAVALDFEYVQTYRKQAEIEAQISELENGGSLGARGQANLKRLQGESASLTRQLGSLVDRGADPGSIVAASLSPEQMKQALRARAASQVEMNLQSQENISNRVGITPEELRLEREKKDKADSILGMEAVKTAQGKLSNLEEKIREGKLQVSRENLPSGYELPEDEGVTTGSFIRQHVISILDAFRKEVGVDKGVGTMQVPAEFKSALSPYVSLAFDPSRQARPSGIALPGGGFSKERSFQDRDITLADAAAHRQDRPKDAVFTSNDVEIQRLNDALNFSRDARGEPTRNWRPDRAPVGSPASRRHADIGKAAELEGLFKTLNDEGLIPGAVTDGQPDFQLLKDHIANLEKTAASLIGPNTPASERSEIKEAQEALARIETIRGSQANRANVAAAKESLEASTPEYEETPERLELERRLRVRSLAERVIKSRSGQRELIGPFYNGETTPPALTGAETSERIRKMSWLPDAVRTEALEQIEAGVAPGLTSRDARRRAGASQVEGLSGDKVREIAAKTDFVAGLEQPRGADPEEVATALGGGGAGGGRGRGTRGGGGFDGWSGGPIHVIVDNTPLAVTLTGEAQGPASNYAEAADISRAKARQSRADFRYATNRGSEEYVQREIDRFRKDGKTDDQIRTLFRGSTFANVADVLLGERAGGRDVRSGLTAIRQQLGLAPTRRQVSSENQDEADRQKAALGAEAEAADRRILARGFQASVTDLLQAPFFESQRASVDRFRNEGNQLASLAKERANLADQFRDTRETRLAARRAASDPDLTKAQRESAEAVAKRADDLFKDVGARLRAVRGDERTQTQRVEQARQGLPGGAEAIRNLGIGALASSGAVALGSIVFQLTSQALSVAEEYVGKELEKLADKLTGFANTASQVGTQLSDATRAAGGQAGVAVAQAAGQVGLTNTDFAAIGGALTQRAQIEAGNKNLVDQLDLIRAGRNFQTGESGLFQPQGGIPGLTRSTGGFFGSDINATPDALTLMTKRLPGLDPQGPFQRMFPWLFSGYGALQQEFYGREKLGNAALSEGAAEGKMPWLFGDVQPDPKALEEFNTAIKAINEDLGKAGTSLRVFTGATDEQGDLLAKALQDVGADANIIQRFQNLGIALQDREGKALTQADIDRLGGSAEVGKEFLESYAVGASKQNSDRLIEQMRPALEAQMAALKQSSDLALRGLQANTGLQNIQNPVIPLEDRLLGSGGGALARFAPGLENYLPLPQANLDTWNDLKDIAIPVMEEINRQTEVGVARLKEFGVSDTQINQIKAYGDQIKSLSTEANDLQLSQQTRDYNRGLELGKRQVSDLVGLNGQLASSVKGIGEVQASNLGVQERIVLEKSRELTLLGQELTQRQINFRIAQAGFGTQGMTGAERAAINEQARYEAEIAQRQLDLQKDITGAQFQIVDEQNLRALQDAIYDLQKFQEDYEINIRLRGINEVIALIDKARGQLSSEAAIIMDEFKSIEQLQISTAATIAQQTGEIFNDVLAKARKTINQIRQELASATTGSPQINSQTGFNTTGYGDTGGPGVVPSNYSGGTAPLVTFGDVYVNDKGDIDYLVSEVERALDRKSSLLGLRAPVGS